MQIGSIGCNHSHWVDSFYPESLPGEWRLTYYANEFPCVLLTTARAGDAGRWQADTHGAFRFHLAFAGASAVELERALELATTLESRMGGIVCGRSGAPGAFSAHCTDLARLLAERNVHIAVDGASSEHAWVRAGIASPLWRPGVAAPGCSTGIVNEPDGGDRRLLRSWIEDFARQASGERPPALFFDGAQCEVQTLREAIVIADLLGV